MTTVKGTQRTVKRSDYAAFIGQIEISEIRLVRGSFEDLAGAERPAATRIEIKTRADYENQEGEFEVSHRYDMKVRAADSKKLLAKMSVVFAVTYASARPLNDQLFEVFQTVNLPVNTRPYFREFAHNCFARMNWPQVIAPAFKVGARTTRSKQ